MSKEEFTDADFEPAEEQDDPPASSDEPEEVAREQEELKPASLPASRAPAIVAGGHVRPIIPQSFEDCYRFGVAAWRSKLAPKDMGSPEACQIAILHGLEIGLKPMTALQRIAVINGRPTIWGDAALGLVRASGLLDDFEETLEGEGDNMVASCRARRRGDKRDIVRQFSVADAKKAELWTKDIWKKYPKRMLQMRARGYTLHDGFADVLGGLYLTEELQGEEDVIDARAVEVISAPDEPKNSPPSPPPPPKSAPSAPPPPENLQVKQPMKEKAKASPSPRSKEKDTTGYAEQGREALAARSAPAADPRPAHKATMEDWRDYLDFMHMEYDSCAGDEAAQGGVTGAVLDKIENAKSDWSITDDQAAELVKQWSHLTSGEQP